MKKMTCKQLGWACDMTFYAESFAKMAEMSKEHGTQMMKKQDPEHLEAMAKMWELMKDPAALQTRFAAKEAEFDALPHE